MIYLDNSATTKPVQKVIEAMSQSMTELYYNPSALYTKAMETEKNIQNTSFLLKKTLNALDAKVIFTSGGTESNNLAILGYLETFREKGEVLYSGAEHSSVKMACEIAFTRCKITAREIPLCQNGLINLDSLKEMLSKETKLICVTQVSNETGVIMPLKEVVALRDEFAPQAAILVDGVQGYLRVPFDFANSGVQFYSISGHKIHASKGIGALFVQNGVKLSPQTFGGGQQEGIRSGTENTVGISALIAAVNNYPSNAAEKMLELKQELVNILRAALPEAIEIGLPYEDERSASHILSIAFPPVRAETLLHALEALQIYVGTGSACHSKKGKHSKVLTAMKLPANVMESAIRISLCPYNTKEEMSCVAKEIINQVMWLRRFSRR